MAGRQSVVPLRVQGSQEYSWPGAGCVEPILVVAGRTLAEPCVSHALVNGFDGLNQVNHLMLDELDCNAPLHPHDLNHKSN